jgi:hypothetical protein
MIELNLFDDRGRYVRPSDDQLSTLTTDELASVEKIAAAAEAAEAAEAECSRIESALHEAVRVSADLQEAARKIGPASTARQEWERQRGPAPE